MDPQDNKRRNESDFETIGVGKDPDKTLKSRRDFLLGLCKWSQVLIGTAILGSIPETDAESFSPPGVPPGTVWSNHTTGRWHNHAGSGCRVWGHSPAGSWGNGPGSSSGWNNYTGGSVTGAGTGCRVWGHSPAGPPTTWIDGSVTGAGGGCRVWGHQGSRPPIWVDGSVTGAGSGCRVWGNGWR